MKAYGTLTIVDLLDTATYIYYATNVTSEGEVSSPSKLPGSATRFIGIYSGPVDDQYDPNKAGWEDAIAPGTTWSEYVGSSGEDGRGITSVIKYYTLGASNTEAPDAPNPKEENMGEWVSTPPAYVKEKYLWVCDIFYYNNGDIEVSNLTCDFSWKTLETEVGRIETELGNQIGGLETSITQQGETITSIQSQISGLGDKISWDGAGLRLHSSSQNKEILIDEDLIRMVEGEEVTFQVTGQEATIPVAKIGNQFVLIDYSITKDNNGAINWDYIGGV